MRKTIVVSLVALALSGCAGGYGPGPNQTGGAITGAVVGGALGSMVGSGSGNTAAIIGGALIGGAIGANVGWHMDQYDYNRAYATLNNTPDYRTVQWNNPNTGTYYEVTPTKTYYDYDQYNGAPCREYTQTATINGKRQTVYGTACRQQDGSWKIVN